MPFGAHLPGTGSVFVCRLIIVTDMNLLKLRYDPPRVLQAARISVEVDFLNGSVAEMTVESTGQEVGGVFDYSAPESTFNHEWGE